MIEIGTLLLECCSFLWRTEHRIGSLEEDHIDCGSPGINQSLVCPIGIDIVSFCPNAAPDTVVFARGLNQYFRGGDHLEYGSPFGHRNVRCPLEVRAACLTGSLATCAQNEKSNQDDTYSIRF